ncbi:MAG: NUDIX domain-containing protein [Saprospiraceae bacterium]|nr:NUDIX domain-containing protein [Saprospiraceae bacterium]
MYKIFINETPLILAKSTPSDALEKAEIDAFGANDKVLKTNYLKKKKLLHNYIDTLEKNPKWQAIVVFDDDLPKLWHDFQSLYRVIEAAGGLVFNEKKEVLVIYRRQSWDLPKGKIDVGETPEKAAIREVQEETGLNTIELGRHLIDTYHTYTHKGERILKKTYWFEMSTYETALTPQYSEDIEDAKWVDLPQFLAENPIIYGNILSVMSTQKKIV